VDNVTAHEHLDASHRAIADLPDEERIQWIRAERWISYPAAELALATMDELLTYPQRNRMPCLLIHGRTGMGKTMILRKFSRDHPRIVDQRLGIAQTPVVLPPEPAEVPFYEEIARGSRPAARWRGEPHPCPSHGA
jgi:Bacterial TniB protein